MQDFFLTIGNSIVTAWNFIVALFRDFISLIKLLAQIPSLLTDFLTWLPPTFRSLALLLISIVIFYKILGREG